MNLFPRVGILLLSVIVGPVQAIASEAVTYEYDALGRLVKTTVVGGSANGADIQTSYDAAGNRITHNFIGSGQNPPPLPKGAIVVPLNGYTVIPTQ